MMKFILTFIIILAPIFYVAHNKQQGNMRNKQQDHAKNYLLTKIARTYEQVYEVENGTILEKLDYSDTINFVYNSRNQLIKYMSQTIFDDEYAYDTLTYNDSGQITGYKADILHEGWTHPFLHGYSIACSINYSGNNITSVDRVYTGGGVYSEAENAASKCKISDNKLIEKRNNGFITRYVYDTRGNMVKSEFQFLEEKRTTTAYTYHTQYYNPYQTAGLRNVWIWLIAGLAEDCPKELMMWSSKDLCSSVTDEEGTIKAEVTETVKGIMIDKKPLPKIIRCYDEEKRMVITYHFFYNE